MSYLFSGLASEGGFGSARLQAVFDAEVETPDLVDQLERSVPQIRLLMASLRESLPLVPHSGVGPIGRSGFYRIPNHYRSVSYILPPISHGDNQASPGVIVFKGTEPLLADFPTYFEWMLKAPFRSSVLPLALHFPMDMKLPPAAMWIEECIAEQAVSSQIQKQYFGCHGYLARLPLPLFVFEMTPQQNARYDEIISSRVPEGGMRNIRKKITDGMGVEVYYYPQLPVRVADLFVGNVRETFKQVLTSDRVEIVCQDWATLFSEMLCLGFMPYAPWHHGMGACVDKGNACIDGGFNDLLTLIPFESVPAELFEASLNASIGLLAETMVNMVAVSISAVPPAADSDAARFSMAYVTQRLREYVLAPERTEGTLDSRLRDFFNPPKFAKLLKLASGGQRGRAGAAHFIGNEEASVARERGKVFERRLESN